MIKKEHIDFLNNNRKHWQVWESAQIFNQLDMSVRDGMLNIYREYWDGGYLANLWCSPCVVDLMKKLYTNYDKWVAEQNKVAQQAQG